MNERELRDLDQAELAKLAIDTLNMPETWAKALSKAKLARFIFEGVIMSDSQAEAGAWLETKRIQETEIHEAPELQEAIGEDDDLPNGGRQIVVTARLNPDKEVVNHRARLASVVEESPVGFNPRAMAPYLENEGRRFGEWLTTTASLSFCRAVYQAMAEHMDSLVTQ